MKKQILIDDETRVFIRKAFGVENVTVWRALNFKRDNALMRRIRKLALERGGRLIEWDKPQGNHVPQCETVHNTAEGTMTQTFGERVRIEADRKSGQVTVWVDGEAREGYTNMSIPEFMKLQAKVEQIAMTL